MNSKKFKQRQWRYMQWYGVIKQIYLIRTTLSIIKIIHVIYKNSFPLKVKNQIVSSLEEQTTCAPYG